MSRSVRFVKEVNGKTGKRYFPSGPMPSRKAVWKSAWLHAPIPFCFSGVMFGTLKTPKGVSRPSPPEGDGSPWQLPQPAASYRYLPRRIACGSSARAPVETTRRAMTRSGRASDSENHIIGNSRKEGLCRRERWPSSPTAQRRATLSAMIGVSSSGDRNGDELPAAVFGLRGAGAQTLEGMGRIPGNGQALGLRAGRREWEDQRFGGVMRDLPGHVMVFLVNMAVEHRRVLIGRQNVDRLGAILGRPVSCGIEGEQGAVSEDDARPALFELAEIRVQPL